jgi:serine/threonine protein kinase
VSLAAGSKLGSYEVLSLLGAGGMGEVYRAREPRLGRDVAIKVLPADRVADEGPRRRFVQEAQAASSLTGVGVLMRRLRRDRKQPSRKVCLPPW